MPVQALRKQYILTAGAFLVGAIGMMIFVRDISPQILGFAMLALIAAAAISFAFAQRKVWVSINSVGIEGRGFLGRRTMIRWDDPIFLSPVSPPRVRGLPGITILKTDRDGIPLHFGSVFVPRVILRSPSFQAALNKHAPLGHPLGRRTAT